MKRVLTVGLTYTGPSLKGVEIENLGLCQTNVNPDRAAFPLYEYDVIILNPQSFTHVLFGQAGPHSGSTNELGALKRENDWYDIDTAFDSEDRRKELEVAVAGGATVVWCMAETKRQNFFGFRETHLGYLAPKLIHLLKRAGLLVKKGRRLGEIDQDSPFARYFDALAKTGWMICLPDFSGQEGYVSIATTPEGYSLGGRVALDATVGWLVTPPTSPEAENQLVWDSLAIENGDLKKEKYHTLFLSHTGDDKPFVRQLRKDLLDRGVPRVWLDEAEIDIGDSLIAKIEEGINLSRFIAVVLSHKSITAPWVKKELDVAMNREIAQGEVVVLPILYEKCELPEFLKGKLYADFTVQDDYDRMLTKLLRRLRVA